MNYKSFVLSISALLIIAFPSFANDSQNLWNDAYSRRDFKLGMTLSDFKSTKHPDQKEWPNAFPKCSNDPEASSSEYVYADISPRGNKLLEEKNVIKCAFFYNDNGRTYGAGLVLGDINSSTAFYFVKINSSKEPVLYKITSGGPSTEFEKIIHVYEKTLGKPNNTHTEPIQNGMGARFENRIVTYKNNSSSIFLEKYSETINKFSVQYLLQDGAQAVKILEEKQYKDLGNKL